MSPQSPRLMMHEPPPLPSLAFSPQGPAVVEDPWAGLRSLTPARIALGRAGHALPTRELLAADEAHARARAAVHAPLDVDALGDQLRELTGGVPPVRVESAAPDRSRYLLRPDLGRRLSAESRRQLTPPAGHAPGCDLAILIADGLSTTAVARHAAAVVGAILSAAPADWRIAPLVLATQARVALGDEVGELLGARLIAVLLGERPGLSCQESLGLYLTWAPRPGRTDAERNCLSNIHPGGLSPANVAHKLWWLAGEARRLSLTGVHLKDRSGAVGLLGENS